MTEQSDAGPTRPRLVVRRVPLHGVRADRHRHQVGTGRGPRLPPLLHRVLFATSGMVDGKYKVTSVASKSLLMTHQTLEKNNENFIIPVLISIFPTVTMRISIVFSGTHAETNWNAFRLANFALQQGDEVKIFLLGEGVEYEKHSSEKFNIQEQLEVFMRAEKGNILACGTCIKSRAQNLTETCPISTLKDLYDMIKYCDRLVTF